jgi:hypothetical protein
MESASDFMKDGAASAWSGMYVLSILTSLHDVIILFVPSFRAFQGGSRSRRRNEGLCSEIC